MRAISAVVLGAFLAVSATYYVNARTRDLPTVSSQSAITQSLRPVVYKSHDGPEVAAKLLEKHLQSPSDPFCDFSPGQNPQQVQAQGQKEGDQRCERPDPKKPEQGYRDPKKIGCKCMRTTPCDPNGNPTEHRDNPETKCKRDCKLDHCDCPNPCKT